MAKILFFQRNDSTYTACLFTTIQRSSTEIVEAIFAGKWVIDNARRGDIALLHWPSFLYSVNASMGACLASFFRFTALLVLLRIKGTRLVWIAHNLMPHDPSRIRQLDIIGRRLVVRLSERILVHGQHAANVLQERFPGALGKIVLIPHGHWIDHYKREMSPERARLKLGIPKEAFVYLFIGACKSYKGLDALVTAFRSCGTGDFLVIAGKFQDPIYEAQILSLIGRNGQVIMRSGFIEDDDLQMYLRACNVVVAPYREILTSGTAMLAMSFGRPIVSIKAGFLIDVVDETVGLLFDATDPAGLVDALQDVKNLRFDENAIVDCARKYTFEQAASALLKTMRVS